MHIVKQELRGEKAKLQTKSLEAAAESFEVSPTAHSPAKSSPSVDLISQMRTNLSQLEDLQSRLGFVVAEVQYLLKRR